MNNVTNDAAAFVPAAIFQDSRRLGFKMWHNTESLAAREMFVPVPLTLDDLSDLHQSGVFSAICRTFAGRCGFPDCPELDLPKDALQRRLTWANWGFDPEGRYDEKRIKMSYAFLSWVLVCCAKNQQLLALLIKSFDEQLLAFQLRSIKRLQALTD